MFGHGRCGVEEDEQGPGWTAIAGLAAAVVIGGVWLERADARHFSALLYQGALLFGALAAVCLALFVPVWLAARRRTPPDVPPPSEPPVD